MLPSAGSRAAASQPTAFAHSAFEEEQKLRKDEIVSRILKEEAEEDRRRRLPPPAHAADRLTLRDRTWGYLATVCEGKPAPAASCYLAVSRGPSGAQCRGDPIRTLTKGPPAPRSPRVPHEGQPCGLTSRQAAPLVAACSDVPMVPSGGHGAAGPMATAWELASPEGWLRCKGLRHRSLPHAPREPTPLRWRPGSEGSPRQGDQRPVTGQGQT